MTHSDHAGPTPETTRPAAAGKYLTFVLANEQYGIEILKVREILGLMKITPVPRTPKYIEGVVNLRGKVIPVIDLRNKFALAAAERTDETCVIVASVSDIDMGIIVDKVSEVKDIADTELEAAPALGREINTDFILSMAKIDDHVVILLNIDNVLTDIEIQFAKEDFGVEESCDDSLAA